MSIAGGVGVLPRPCRSCGEEVYDLLYPKTGKSAPIEVRLSTNGNVVVDLVGGTYRILSGLALEAARRDGSAAELHVNHFVQCPQAGSWHERSAQKARS